jgi:hypothetical protein
VNILKKIEDIIKVRDELHEIQKKVEYLRRELDGTAAELIGFLRETGQLKK